MARSPPRDEPAEARSGRPEGDLPDSVKIFAQRLVEARREAGLTQVQLAERSGVSQPHISQLEKGNLEPRLSTILSLAAALGVESAVLTGEKAMSRQATSRSAFQERVKAERELALMTNALLARLRYELGPKEVTSRFRGLKILELRGKQIVIGGERAVAIEDSRLLAETCAKTFEGIEAEDLVFAMGLDGFEEATDGGAPISQKARQEERRTSDASDRVRATGTSRKQRETRNLTKP